MKQKKKIDDIYREGLKNAQVPPPPDSWDFISAHLPEEENKKKIFPLWLKFAGVAAVVALLITALNFAIFDIPVTTPLVNQKEGAEEERTPASEITPEAEPSIANSIPEEQKDKHSTEAVVYHEKSSAKKDASSETANSSGTYSILKKNNFASEAQRTAIAAGPAKEISSKGKNSVVPAEESVNPEAFAETSEASEVKNPVAPLKNEINNQLFKEEALAEAEAKATPENESFLKRLRISTTAGAVYFNMNNNNTVDPQFSQNAGGSEVSIAYGVNLAYEVSEKVKIRSGVSKVNFNYSTRQVDYSTASSSSAVRAEPAGMGIMLAAQGDLEQEFGFIEIPLEVEFALVDRKFGINLIGGASTFLLEKNNLSMKTATFTTNFGEAQNINDLSFSANLGLGVHYNFTPRVRLNLEPIFKYQLNTFDHANSHYFGIYSGLSYQF